MIELFIMVFAVTALRRVFCAFYKYYKPNLLIEASIFAIFLPAIFISDFRDPFNLSENALKGVFLVFWVLGVFLLAIGITREIRASRRIEM